MSEDERTLADTRGAFVQVIQDGRKVADVAWIAGRLLLSNRRLVLASEEGKRTIPLSAVSGLTIREDVGESIPQVSGYISCQVGTDVFLLGPTEFASFQSALFSALLDDQTVLIKHPVVKGGVVQDSAWESGKMNVDGEVINLAIATGTFVEISLEDVGTVAEATRTVGDEERPVLEIEHAQEGETVETHVAGSKRATSLLSTFARLGESGDVDDVDLTQAERAVLMALYTGVSPFEIPDFVGMDVEQVEAIYDDLVAEGVLEEAGTRREVELKARGRSIAGEAMADQ